VREKEKEKEKEKRKKESVREREGDRERATDMPEQCRPNGCKGYTVSTQRPELEDPF
jgi:hypothetical protein